MRSKKGGAVRLLLVVATLMFYLGNFSSANAAIYIQLEGNQVDVESGIDGATIDGNGFGGRFGYRWKSLGFEAGYTTASAELDGQVFSPTDKYEADYTLITAGVRWWLGRWFDLSTGFLSVSGDTELSITIPLLGGFAGKDDFSASGFYFGAAFNIPLNRFDIFLAYNLYRWSAEEYKGDLAGLESDEGINTISAGVRVTF